MTSGVESEVDRLLLELGEYTPLELLLHSGRILYVDYEAWRDGKLEFLDQVLFGDPDQVGELLARAGYYLERRGWRAERVEYQPWSPQADAGDRPLRFSATADLEVQFHRRYRRPDDQPQLDLFIDSRRTALHNGILQALGSRDRAECRRLLERLADVAPDHPRLGGLERLTEALEDLDRDVEDVGGELARLEETVTPLAAELLGPTARDLLIPLWRRLSDALEARPFDASAPKLHLSHTAAQALDWRVVRKAVEAETGWRHEPLLLERHAAACERLHEFTEALPAWFALCWQFPGRAERVESSSNPLLAVQWEAFQDHEPALPVTDFPAWLLARRPALTRVLPEPDVGCPDSYVTMYRLQGRRAAQAPDAGVVELRTRLRTQDPLLFSAYMKALNATRV